MCLRFLIFLISLGCLSSHGQSLYYPTHHTATNGLSTWITQKKTIGFCREVENPQTVWLMLHGNAGQAADRSYALPSFPSSDSVFILEYPGYGQRPGTPSLESFNLAAMEAYEILRVRFPRIPVFVVGESIGSGPASALASELVPPSKIVLIVPFDILENVAHELFPALPETMKIRDNWNNIKSLKSYQGPIEIFGAKTDSVIRIAHARALAASKPSAIFHEIDGGHNEWSKDSKVKIKFP